MNMTLCELLWSILLLVIVSYFWNLGKDAEGTLKPASNNPVILWWTEGFPGSSDTKHCPDSIQCDVYSSRNLSNVHTVHAYLFYGSNINFSDLPVRKPEDTIWGLYHEESPRNVEALMHEPVLNLFNFSSTYSRHSDVPYPLQYLESFEDITSRKYFIETSEKNAYLKDIAPILYIQSDCETSTERDIYVKELIKNIKVDSYGACVNNLKLPDKFTGDYLNNLNEDEFLKFVARYKFVISIENGVCEDYVTEKFWRAIKVGSVPIYFGSPSVRDWFPNKKSAILLEDFPTPKVLSDHIYKLLKNDDLYETYLEHKTKQIVANAQLIREFTERPYQLDSLLTVEKFECYVCKMLHKRIGGDYTVNIVAKSHYDCPKPLSALTLGENPANSWVQTWAYSKEEAEKINKRIMNRV
ncbi:Alpha-(1,3)-fucosyltransferase 10 [Operophtera brumata]|uniref:Fucosyltransferase n=1 Tax=Operophtera brumata TaxID=104452 RepID=A0A0L7L0Y6_OPEBR|nr:Alpha-(1,3)-fucosyltransferase 10 [Operophtera brumata]